MDPSEMAGTRRRVPSAASRADPAASPTSRRHWGAVHVGSDQMGKDYGRRGRGLGSGEYCGAWKAAPVRAIARGLIALLAAAAVWTLVAGLWPLVPSFPSLSPSPSAFGRPCGNLLGDLGYPPRPRMLGYYFANAVSSRLSSSAAARLAPAEAPFLAHRAVRWTEEDEAGRRRLLDSVRYQDMDHRPLRPYDDAPECVPMHEWQVASYPTCNDVHGTEMTDLSSERNRVHRQLKLLANGYFRDVWAITEYDGETIRILKTTRYRHGVDAQNLDRHRMDANAFSALTASPRILDIYAYCGTTGAFEYAPGGSVSDLLFEETRPPTLEKKFDIAMQAVRALAELHNFNGRAPAIAHADMMTNQFVLVGDRYKLNDFNRCTFLFWNSTSNAGNCPYIYGDYNAWLFRSPEEYRKYYNENGSKMTHKKVKAGALPALTDELRNSDDPIIAALLTAMDMCHRQDWRGRASAKEVEAFLSVEWEKCVTEERCEPGPDDEIPSVPIE